MEKIAEQRSEQRLLYRWPVRFTFPGADIEESHPAQIFDASSRAMSFLCDSEDQCPGQGQQLTLSFSAPYFNHSSSFDTVLFERKCLVRRVDQIADRVNRVAVDFNEPLFFKPGEQETDLPDIQKSLQTHSISIIRAVEKAKACSRALAQAHEQTRTFAQAKAKLEQMLQIEIENKAKFEAEIRLKTQKEIISHIESAARAQEKAKAEAKARSDAETMAKKVIKAAEKAEKNLDAQAEKKAKLLVQDKVSYYNQQITALQADFAKTIAQIKEQVDETITQLEAKCQQISDNKTTLKEVRSRKKTLLKKLDKFVTDTNRFF
jgi:hypothetical protein